MSRNLLAIITNTFTEILRQPIYGVVMGIILLVLILSPSLAMFTMDDDNQLLKDIGLSTLLVGGLFLAVFAAATVVTDEIENKTVLTVLSKTISRATFILGKFFGVAAAILLAQYMLSLVLLIVVRHGVLQTARDQHDWVVMILGGLAITATLLTCLMGNYFYRWCFSSTFALLGSISATLLLAVLLVIDPQWQFNPAQNNIAYDLIEPLVLTIIAVLILTAIAVTAATRLNLVMTLTVCGFVFLLGCVLHYWLTPVIQEQSGWILYIARLVMTVIPSFHFYVVSNAIYSGKSIPLEYLGQTAVYAVLYVSAVLMFAIALIRSRQIS